VEHSFTWLSALRSAVPLLEPLPEHALTSIFVTLLLIGLALVVRLRMGRPEDAVVPDERVSVGLIAQYFVEGMSSLAEGVIGHGAVRYVPLLGSFFIFILVSNLLGLIPGFLPPTSDFNITLGLGVVSFVAYHVCGLQEHGPKYIRQFLGPVLWLAPLMVVVEVFSHTFRPISLGIRLFANLLADHTVLAVFTGFFPHVLLPVPFYVLGAFVSVIQAFVFTMLSAIYIALAVSHEH
jgi:F-type H+-transporting ATPase subunit a